VIIHLNSEYQSDIELNISDLFMFNKDLEYMKICIKKAPDFTVRGSHEKNGKFAYEQ